MLKPNGRGCLGYATRSNGGGERETEMEIEMAFRCFGFCLYETAINVFDVRCSVGKTKDTNWREFRVCVNRSFAVRVRAADFFQDAAVKSIIAQRSDFDSFIPNLSRFRFCFAFTFFSLAVLVCRRGRGFWHRRRRRRRRRQFPTLATRIESLAHALWFKQVAEYSFVDCRANDHVREKPIAETNTIIFSRT
jgi:hypothetical protein